MPEFTPGSSLPGAAREQQATLAEFPDYGQAQALVDRLADAGFAVEHVRIVGTDIRTVEQVTGRMTTGKSALMGAGTGAWLGLLIGLIFGLFSAASAWVGVILGSVALGAGWGAIFGAVAHWATRGRRDFSSVRGLEASRYAVTVDASYHAEAARVAGL